MTRVISARNTLLWISLRDSEFLPQDLHLLLKEGLKITGFQPMLAKIMENQGDPA